MYFISIGSGSKGNCFLICDHNTTLMVDCGIGINRVRKAMKEFHIESIDALLLTHGHSDHTKTRPYFKQYPTYAMEPTLNPNVELYDFKSFNINHLKITPFALSHDANNTCGFYIDNGSETLFYCTDTGYVPSKVMQLGSNATYYIMESNHDIDMLMATNRPYYLKSRILGDTGHMNNQDCAQCLKNMIGNDTKAIYLAHISQQANDYLLAYQENKEVLDNNGYQGILEVLKQDEVFVGGTYESLD